MNFWMLLSIIQLIAIVTLVSIHLTNAKKNANYSEKLIDKINQSSDALCGIKARTKELMKEYKTLQKFILKIYKATETLGCDLTRFGITQETLDDIIEKDSKDKKIAGYISQFSYDLSGYVHDHQYPIDAHHLQQVIARLHKEKLGVDLDDLEIEIDDDVLLKMRTQSPKPYIGNYTISINGYPKNIKIWI